jgi:hypothetical protein
VTLFPQCDFALGYAKIFTHLMVVGYAREICLFSASTCLLLIYMRMEISVHVSGAIYE